jgi:hypothetical protein
VSDEPDRAAALLTMLRELCKRVGLNVPYPFT